ncbi:MAG TPA: hypothetical protein VHY37_10290 [Tepidisphaeraceae bacterium]|jgi:hypothetical protein|nr:hypothetical protein [Tepidisphaeraceae bacterium]
MGNDFDWSPQPGAAAWVAARSSELRRGLPFAEEIKNRLLAEAGVRFDDLIDTILIGNDEQRISDALSAGWVRGPDDHGRGMYTNPNGIFPQVAVFPLYPAQWMSIILKVESVADFLSAWKLERPIDPPAYRLRSAGIEENEDLELDVVERLAWRGLWTEEHAVDPKMVAEVLDQFRRRQREFAEDAEGFDYTDRLIDRAITSVGRDVACQLFFAAEREYWMSRNRAGRAQYARQQRLGLGWANHDHHTYRSSRKYFSRLVGLWEKLGFACRERFYAGREAGWGAQVMEQPIAGIVTFNDLDLSPDELRADFAHEPLAPRPPSSLGTVGLWCGLHGESLLQAGMHHLEAQFSFDALRDQLAAEDVKMLEPFTDFPHLRQAFTEGERWPVAEKRIATLLAEKLITPEQAKQFREQGAIGSHLENLERNAGFKGFNQTGVSEIITATDPRKNLASI